MCEAKSPKNMSLFFFHSASSRFDLFFFVFLLYTLYFVVFPTLFSAQCWFIKQNFAVFQKFLEVLKIVFLHTSIVKLRKQNDGSGWRSREIKWERRFQLTGKQNVSKVISMKVSNTIWFGFKAPDFCLDPASETTYGKRAQTKPSKAIRPERPKQTTSQVH